MQNPFHVGGLFSSVYITITVVLNDVYIDHVQYVDIAEGSCNVKSHMLHKLYLEVDKLRI